eukprot:CAMPEP_0178481256 /NCGR_PEP_ID=MMETSP0696-20121128/6117_1 /TAXON_ID=265572 /ORGANISM="Extubocellulus spinifer, Strain CCMP396" /LENGTH=395 /DNA_ID=CAMNT_0020108721 /DNA_START=376 /DNA_END=1563 /DNA_ORIENTATION=-
MIAKTKFGRPVRAKHHLANEQSLSSSTTTTKIQSSKSSTSSTRRRTTCRTNKGASVVSARAKISSRHFPLQLHDMLNDSEDKGFEDIVSWQPHGRCFVVHRPKDFVEHIMPVYFKQSKFPSFQRQLNLYGFSRITQGKDKNGYHHDLFLRGMPELTGSMMRIKVKGTRVRRAPRPDEEPDFYSYPPLSDVAKVGATEVSSMNDTSRPTKKKSKKNRAPKEPSRRLKDTLKITAPTSMGTNNSVPSSVSDVQAILVTPPDSPRTHTHLLREVDHSPPRDMLMSILEDMQREAHSCLEDEAPATKALAAAVEKGEADQPWPSLEWPHEGCRQDMTIKSFTNDFQLDMSAFVSSPFAATPAKREESVLFFEGKPFHYLESDALYSRGGRRDSIRALAA